MTTVSGICLRGDNKAEEVKKHSELFPHKKKSCAHVDFYKGKKLSNCWAVPQISGCLRAQCTQAWVEAREAILIRAWKHLHPSVQNAAHYHTVYLFSEFFRCFRTKFFFAPLSFFWLSCSFFFFSSFCLCRKALLPSSACNIMASFQLSKICEIIKKEKKMAAPEVLSHIGTCTAVRLRGPTWRSRSTEHWSTATHPISTLPQNTQLTHRCRQLRPAFNEDRLYIQCILLSAPWWKFVFCSLFCVYLFAFVFFFYFDTGVWKLWSMEAKHKQIHVIDAWWCGGL